MPDPRTSLALLQLADIGRVPDPPPWRWAIVRLEGGGRLRLSPEARAALGAEPGHIVEVRGLCGPVALVLRPAGRGRAATIDARGRLYVPMWLRSEVSPSYLIGTRTATATVVVAPTTVLDDLGDQLLGEQP